ncbi:MAG TPA: YigZ family protein [Symbiobacteriaceae bacterium]|nr:YigZ family protein [Symbiobacteriaceae bacterium]
MGYKSVRGPAQTEIVIKRSRFIAHVAPVSTEAEAVAFIQRIRTEHAEATHNCYAYKAGNAVRLSDDGEPSGTAGRPIFDVIEKQAISDVCVVVTRYFGGILLGAGGLVRAYSQSAAAGVEAAGVAETVPALDLRLTLDYGLVGKVQYLLEQVGALTLDSQYGHEVTVDCRILGAWEADLLAQLQDLSAGRIQVERLRELNVGGDLRPLHD